MFRPLILAIPVLVFGAMPALVQEETKGRISVIAIVDGTRVGFEPVNWPKEFRRLGIQVKGPSGYLADQQFGNKIPELDLREFVGKNDTIRDKEGKEKGELEDGFYFFQITGATGETIKVEEIANNGRGKGKETGVSDITFAVAGQLLLKNGSLVKFENQEEKGSEDTKPGDGPKDDSDGKEEVEPPDPDGKFDDNGRPIKK